jgi:hypothetical protein
MLPPTTTVEGVTVTPLAFRFGLAAALADAVLAARKSRATSGSVKRANFIRPD